MDQFEKAYNQHGSLAGVAAYGIAKCYLCWFEQVWNPIRPYFDSFCKRKIKKRSSYQKKYQEDKKLAEDLCGHLWHWARLERERTTGAIVGRCVFLWKKLAPCGGMV